MSSHISTIEEVIDNVQSELKSKTRPYLIGIAGGSASGKTAVANIIFKFIGIQDCLLFSMDSYYKGPNDEERKNMSEYNFDHPNAIDFELVSEHLKILMEGKSIDMPIYNFAISKREQGTVKVNPSNLIIFEGILALYDKRLRDLMDMKIFVDSDGDIRLARRSKINF